jgi:phage major head subunit gpT-like protein
MEGLTEKPAQWSSIFKKKTMDGYDYVERNFSGLGYMQETYEGATFILDEMKQGNVKRVYSTKRSLGIETTEEAEADDRWGIIKQLPAELGRSAAATDELIAFLNLNQAFAGPRVGIDSVYLCSASHPYIGSATVQSNLVTGALGVSTLQDGLNKMNNLKLSNGRPALARADILLVAAGSDNYWIAKDLTKNEFKYQSADRDLNPFTGEGLTMVAVDWLSTNTNWFLLDSKLHDLTMFTRMENKKTSGVDPRNGNSFMSYKHRKTADFFNWQGVVGSTGA